MNYQNKKVAITGANGFIGSALVKALEGAGAYIDILEGDVRNPETFGGLNYEYDYLFHFADPSSQVLFKRQPFYAAEVTLKGFLNAAAACRRDGIKLVYPSTGLLSSDRENEYARCKKICEDIQLGEGFDALAVRIFAAYGPGESHKRDFASVPYLFARDMVQHKSPVIFGDGKQVRDFIYIDDVVAAILILAEECNDPVVDIGSGTSVSFNDIVRAINTAAFGPVEVQLADTHWLLADYIDKPAGYVQETAADPSRLRQFYTPKVSFEEGVTLLVKHLTEGK